VVERCGAASPDRPFVHLAAFLAGEGRESGTKGELAVFALRAAFVRFPDLDLGLHTYIGYQLDPDEQSFRSSKVPTAFGSRPCLDSTFVTK